MQTKAVAAHFTFEPQRYVYHTDLLLRYRAYANERVCAADNQKEEFPDWQKTLEKWGVEPIEQAQEKEERKKLEQQMEQEQEEGRYEEQQE